MTGQPSSKEFLNAIWGIWADGPAICSIAFGQPDPANHQKTKAFWERPYNYPNDIDKLLSEIPGAQGRSNIYFGVCLKKEKWPRKNVKGEEEKRATKENTLSATCAWVDIDFKNTPLEVAIKRLKEFPLKTSIGVLSGGGIQTYWLFKEPLTSVEEFARLESVNQRLAKILGGDHTQDTARVLRMPGTLNVKYDPPRPSSIAPGTWRPHLTYTLDDLEQYLPAEEERLQPSLTPDTVVPPAGGESIDVETLQVSAFAKRVIREGLPAYIEFRKATDPPEKFAERQSNNQLSRSEADAWAVSQLLAANLSDAQIYTIYRDPANRVGEKYRERKDGDKYLGVTVREMKKYRSEHPRTPSGAAAEWVGRKVGRNFGERKFEIVRVFKLAYEQPIYDVTTRVTETGEEHQTRCALKELACFYKFREVFLAQHDMFPPTLKQGAWEDQVNGLKFQVQKVDHEIATTNGEVRAALDEWISQAQHEPNEATLQYLPVSDPETSKVYMRLPAFMQYLQSQKIETKRREVIQILKDIGCEPGNKRFGKGVARVWVKPHENGQTKDPSQAELIPEK